MARIKQNTTFAADFETTGSPDACRVWAWAYRDIATSETIARGTHVEEFVDQARAGTYYFHNSGFDLAFVLDELLRRRDYEWVELDTSARGKAEGRHVLKKSQFTSLIGDQGQHYEVSWTAPSGGTVVVRDSLRKAPGTLEELGRAFGHETPKGETPLHWELPDDYEPTPEEWAYLDTDTSILALVMRTLIGEGLTSMTIGGDCFRDWKKRLRAEHGHDDRGDGAPEGANDVFRRLFPELQQVEDDAIRQAYRGGWTYCDPRTQGRVLTGGGTVYDVNSMYPAVQVDEMFPHGRGVKLAPGETPPEGYLTITGAVVTATLRPDHVPCIPNNTLGFGDSGWATEVEEVELWGTGQEWELWAEHYELEIDRELGGYAYAPISGREIFGGYIAEWMRVKETTTGPQRLIAKLMLNNLWGKFGTNPVKGQRVPTLPDTSEPVRLQAGTPSFDAPIYTPVAIFVTAYARERIVRAAQANYARFTYADTDSLHLLGTEPPEGVTVHDTHLGAWAHEGDWTEAVYCRAKAYIERMSDGEISIAMAGLPREAREGLTPESVYDGQEFDGKLTKTRVVGGIVLSPIKWRLDYRLGIHEVV